MYRFAIAMLAVVLLGSSAAAGGWHDFDGKAAPEISASQWLNVSGGPVSRRSLKGKVWLLNFIGVH